jgi:hypothetical protein
MGKMVQDFPCGGAGQRVNLAAEFLDNPFSAPFRAVESAVSEQQQYESLGVRIDGKSVAEGWRRRDASWDETALEKVRKLEAAARAAAKPVKHTLTVTPVP